MIMKRTAPVSGLAPSQNIQNRDLLAMHGLSHPQEEWDLYACDRGGSRFLGDGRDCRIADIPIICFRFVFWHETASLA